MYYAFHSHLFVLAYENFWIMLHWPWGDAWRENSSRQTTPHRHIYILFNQCTIFLYTLSELSNLRYALILYQNMYVVERYRIIKHMKRIIHTHTHMDTILKMRWLCSCRWVLEAFVMFCTFVALLNTWLVYVYLAHWLEHWILYPCHLPVCYHAEGTWTCWMAHNGGLVRNMCIEGERDREGPIVIKYCKRV